MVLMTHYDDLAYREKQSIINSIDKLDSVYYSALKSYIEILINLSEGKFETRNIKES
jgi:hypothetical protein